ncbi:MAG: tRNA 2-thiocytidine(32) synthetase TtcA [Peptococcaceae bacterium]|nr:tRNA 2-thiocytidine(32) synthetase TtcA [Peptococcaceae bacterium]
MPAKEKPIADKILHKMRKAITDYGMIDNEEPILVGLSGGKDSLTLLNMLVKFHRSSKYKYKLAAGHIALGNNKIEDANNSKILAAYCKELDVPFFYKETNIGEIIFDIRKESNPCALCAKMRRGALNNLAKENGFSKVALGHHLDDVLETLLLKMFFEGNIDSFKPVSWLSNMEITVIRPLIYVKEAEVSKYAKTVTLPVVHSFCPADGFTKRQDMKEIISHIEKLSPGCKDRALSALQHLADNSWNITEQPKEMERPRL